MRTDFIEKLRIVFLPTFLILLTTALVYPFVAWLIVLKFAWIQPNDLVWEFALPFFLSSILYLVFLKKRFHLLALKPKKRNDTGHFAMAFGSILLLSFPSIVACTYLSKASYDLIKIAIPSEAKYEDNQRYYAIEQYYVDTNFVLLYPEVHTSGKYSQNLELSLYVIAPIFNPNVQGTFNHSDYWYGIQYHKQISNRLSQYEKEELYQQFVQESQTKWHQNEFYKETYLERVLPSDKLENFLQALKEAEFDISTVLIFEPNKESFEKRTGNTFHWIFYSLGISILALFLMSTLPKFSTVRIDKYRKGEQIRDEEFESFVKYLIPKNEYFITSILIDLNILCFIIACFWGLSLFQPTAEEVIKAGGVGINEVAEGAYWRILTGMFVHGGVIHLLANMVGLAVGGLLIEQKIGRVQFTIVYIISGIVATITSLAFADYRVTTGASGAIFGLYGATIGLLLTKAVPKESKRGLWLMVAIYGGANLILGLITPQVDNAAHVGGLIAGIFCGLALHYFGLISQKSSDNY